MDEKVEQPQEVSESEEEFGSTAHARTSEDVRRHDHETLTAEEEAETLLGVREEKPALGRRLSEKREARRQRRRDARRQRRSGKEDDSELFYKYDDSEGARRSSSSEGSEADMRRLKETQSRHKSSRISRFFKFTAIHILIITLFLGFLYGAYCASSSSNTATTKTTYTPQKLSNGTHVFAPTTLLLSLDGFRADFLMRNLTPTLNSFIREGISPKFMQPVFPSLTFPNHYTLVTGVYPECHGIVGNNFYDPATGKHFSYAEKDNSMQPEWWHAEPLWLTAELQGVRSAIHMWPGSEAHIGSKEPDFVDEFNGHERLDRKVDRILNWLDLPAATEDDDAGKDVRPQLIAAYVPNVDQDGHKYGPNSTNIRSTILETDGMLGMLFNGINQRNLRNIINVIVVSDHGMATTSNNRLVQLSDLIDESKIEHIDGWPLYGLRPHDKDPAHLMELYNILVAKSKLPQYKDAFDVYLRDENMPARYHFSNNPRIAPLWIVPKVGWAIVTKDEFNITEAKKNGDVYSPKGLHGYDHEHPLMRAIFVARGPAFPHEGGSRVDEFQSTDVYNIVCDSLGLEPKPNNGTIRLPFRPKGKHNFDMIVEVPEDLPDDDDQLEVVPNLAGGAGMFGVPPMIPEGSLPPIQIATPTAPAKAAEPTRPVMHGGTDEAETDTNINNWVNWVKGKLDGVRTWMSETFGWKKEKPDEEGKDVGQKESGE